MAHPRQDTTRVDWLGLWVLFSAWCAVSGWVLSALGCLNVPGVCGSTVVFGLVLILLWRPLELAEISHARRWPLLRSRRLLPRFWRLIAVLAFIGGAAYVPNNYDHLTYRFPRVLHWAWEQGWYWIPSPGGGESRMNLSGPQFEWMMTPLFILFKTDRFFFLINFISYLFLPGLVFSVFRGLGISPRVSWWWMWVFPCGYCFVLQAGSVGNDAFGAVYLLAAFHFLFRAGTSRPMRNGALSLLAIALMTGTKASNLPLVLPWAVLLYFIRRRVWAKARPVALAVTLVAAAFASFLPIGVMNWRHTGDFFGDPTNSGHLKVDGPVGGIVGNFLQIGSQNIAPPLWYKELHWTESVPAFLKPMLQRSFPRLDMTIRELPGEEGAGIGLGCVAGAALFFTLGLCRPWFDRRTRIDRSAAGLWVSAAVLAAALVYMAKIGTEAAPRVVTPYYSLVIASVLVLAAPDGREVRRRFVKWTGFLVMLSAIPMLVLSPARPLFPAARLVNDLDQQGPAGLRRFRDVYQIYALRSFEFMPFLPLIPPEDRAVGFLQNGDTPEVSLWRPFGSREVVAVSPDDSVADLKAQGIQVVVVSKETLGWRYHSDLATLLNRWSAHLVAQQDLRLKVQRASDTWYVIEL